MGRRGQAVLVGGRQVQVVCKNTHVHKPVHVLMTCRRGDGVLGACSWFWPRRIYRVQRLGNPEVSGRGRVQLLVAGMTCDERAPCLRHDLMRRRGGRAMGATGAMGRLESPRAQRGGGCRSQASTVAVSGVG